MGVMRHEIAETPIKIGANGMGLPTSDTWWFEEKEKVHTIAPDPILEVKDYFAFSVGLGVLLAIAVFALWRML
jgi:hypothetical protein